MYDNNGNILKRREFVFTLKDATLIEELESTDKTYTYNGDQMALYHDEACEHDAKGNPTTYNGEACVYDRMGNPTMYRGKATMWENGRRLASYDVHTFTYDGQGRRLTKDNVEFTYDSNGKLIAQSNGLEFFYDNTGVAGFTYSGAVYLYRKDVQGNIIAILNDDGEIVARYFYDAWGNHAVVDNSGATIVVTSHIGHLNPFRYRGYYYDAETKLYYLKTRYYDSETGRFISQDAIEYLDPNRINGLNLYAYCLNNPVMSVDHNGTIGFFTALFIGILIGAVVVGGGFAIYAGVTAYNNGARGWDVVTAVVDGFFKGAVIGAIIGGLIATMIYAAPAIGSFLGTSFTFGGFALAGGGATAAITVTGAEIVAAGLAALAAMGIMFSSYQRKPAAPRNHSGSRKEAYDKAFQKGGKKKPILHFDGKFGPHFHPAGIKFKHWHYYFALLFGFAFNED